MTAAAAAFLDANVLYSSVIRNLLMYLHLGGLYRPAWSDAVHDEWIEALLRQRTDLNRGQLQRTRDLMNEHALGASITDFEHLIPSLELPDAKDRHVVAAAITCGADFIVTMNVRDFPAHVLAPNGIRAIHPDEFVLDLSLTAFEADHQVHARTWKIRVPR